MHYKHRWLKFNGITIGRNSPYLLTTIQGISEGTVSRKETNYIDQDGAEFSDVSFNTRPFPVTGYILTDSETVAERRCRELSAACIPKKPFKLVYFNGLRKFAAECYADELPVFTKINSKNFQFSINFINTGFYWNDVKLMQKNVNAKEDMVINGSFVLPMVFTRMYSSAEVRNYGDVETEPVITVTAIADSEEQTVAIVNETTGKTVGINYQLVNGEVLTFDHTEGDITSNIAGNVINKLIKTSDFWALEPGVNVVSSPNTNVQVSIQYKSRYVGVGA